MQRDRRNCCGRPVRAKPERQAKTGAVMRNTPVLGGRVPGGRRAAWTTVLALAFAQAAAAQTAPPAAPPAPPAAGGSAVVTADVKQAPGTPSDAILPAGCSSCGGGWVGDGSQFNNLTGCNLCVPGRTRECMGCCATGPIGRFFCGLYEGVCCPDPCYEPRWIAAANAAFFVDSPR